MQVTPADLYVFGKRSGPRAPRLKVDIFPDPAGFLGPQDPKNPSGASAFSDALRTRLNGHYHKLPAGTPLPTGLEVVADGVDVNPNSHHGPGHHTFFPTVAMEAAEFIELFLNLPWTYAGKK